MTFGRLAILGVVLWALLAVLKLLFVNVLNFDSTFFQYLYWFFIVVISMAVCRRLGVINFLEAMAVAMVWVLLCLLLDFLILSSLFGSAVFGHWQLWVGYGVAALSIFFFHKKRHIQIRHEQHAAHHGHGHGHGGSHGNHKSHGDHSQQPHGHHEPGKHH